MRNTPRNISNVQHTTSKCFKYVARYLEIFSDSIREGVPNDLSFAVTWGIYVIYRCRGNFALYCMTCIRVFGRGEVTESLSGSLPGVCPPGHIHALSTSDLLPQYTPSLLVEYCTLCTLCTLWKDLVWSVTEILDSSLWQTQQL